MLRCAFDCQMTVWVLQYKLSYHRWAWGGGGPGNFFLEVEWFLGPPGGGVGGLKGSASRGGDRGGNVFSFGRLWRHKISKICQKGLKFVKVFTFVYI